MHVILGRKRHTAYMNLSSKVMRSDLLKVCLALVLAIGCASGGSLCERGRTWWNKRQGVCIPCTRCDPAQRQAVKYPCQLHRDTVCHSLYEVRIWPFNTPRRTKNATKSEQSSGDGYDDYANYDDEVSDNKSVSDGIWDLHTSTLVLAASGCSVFFMVVLFLSLYHAKQWRVIKQALKSDVQDLSAKLKLMEASLETSTDPIVPTDHHIYCNIHHGKDILLGTRTKKGLGNVYTQEKH